jgi:membrane-bound lytic murein transglycosylase B
MTSPSPLANPDDDFLTPGPSQPKNNLVPGTAMSRLARAMQAAEPDGSFAEDTEFYNPEASVANIGRGVANPYGSGLEAYEPNTVFFGQDVYSEAYAASQQSKMEEEAASQLLTGDFSVSGGGGSNGGQVSGVPYASIFNEAGQKYGVPGSLLAAVARAESNFNSNARSPAGAQGLMQFMPGTAAGLGVNPYDVRSSIFGAAKYLKQQIDRFGSVELGLAAYNAGPEP